MKHKHRRRILKHFTLMGRKYAVFAVLMIAAGLFFHLSKFSISAGSNYEPGYFQVGWFHSLNDVSNVDDLARTGVKSAFLAPAFYTGLDNYLLTANSNGAKVGLGLNLEWFSSAGVDVTKIKNAIKRYKNYSVVASYMAADEPNQFRGSPYFQTPMAVKTAYDAIKSVDSKRVLVNFNRNAGDSEIREYSSGFDIFGIDFYTGGRGQAEFGNIGTWNTFVSEIKRGVALQTEFGKGFWPVIQAFGPNNNRNNIQPPPFRLPTAKEFRFMTFLPFVYRTDGLLLYAYQFAKEYPEWMNSVLEPTLDEIAQYSHLNRNVQLATVDTRCIECAQGIRFQTMRDKNNPRLNYLVVVNETKNTLTPTYNFTHGLTKIERIDNGGRRWTGVGLLSVQDEVPAFGVYVYKLTSDRAF